MINELDLTSLAKFSSLSVQSENSSKRLISESNQEIISYPQIKEDRYNDESNSNEKKNFIF